MTETTDSPKPAAGPQKTSLAALLKTKPIKTLPTDRIGFDTQLAILRAYAAASGPDKQATTNADVAKIADVAASSISICNPFFTDCGLLIREGIKQRPVDALFDYLAAWEWNSESAGVKLAAVLSSAWFAKALLPKLAFRSLSRDEAITFLAEEARASKDYKSQLDLLIEFLVTAGLVTIDGNMLSKVAGKREGEPAPQDGVQLPKAAPDSAPADAPADDVETFSIPLPGKPSATIIVPKGLDADDWDMLSEMMATYIKRWKKGMVKNGETK